MRPPTRAWDELVGNPNHHVMTSQEMAPVRTASSSQAVTIFGSIVPFPIVEATLTPKTKAATKLKNAAQSTATRGVRTLVETTVATELAASWNPFMKSNPRATTTTRTTISNGTVVDTRRTSSWLGILQDNVPDHLNNILTLVGNCLHQFVDLLELDDSDRIGRLEKGGD